MRDHLLLYVNGQHHRVCGPAAFAPLTDFLRRDLGLTGTKVVCAEGDCGSCNVFVGRPDGTGGVAYAAVCGCIQYLYQLDGRHVVTVEGLSKEGELNPVQAAMVKCNGAQCGFCTPGFVVAMQAVLERGEPNTEELMRRGLVGNLCRCTGYEPILRAGREIEVDKVRRLSEMYGSPEMAAELDDAAADPVAMASEGVRFFKPVTLATAVTLRADHPDAAILSGGTDLGVLMNYGKIAPEVVISTAGLPHFSEVSRQGDALVLGGGATLTQLEEAAKQHLPELAGLLAWFGSPPIKNAGTVGGNLATGSPIGDTLPALIALGAEVELTGPGGSRRVALDAFYTGYRASVMAADELITRVHIPLPPTGSWFKLYKVSRRKDLDISTFSAAILIEGNGTIDAARIAFGGVGPTVLRMSATEVALVGEPFTEEIFKAAGKVAAGEVTPLSDVRGSEHYRRKLAENILLKFFHETAAPPAHASNGNGRARKPTSRITE